jgi:hypothetical protein
MPAGPNGARFVQNIAGKNATKICIWHQRIGLAYQLV